MKNLFIRRKKQPETIPVVGVCRFSLPTLTGFQRDFESMEERIAYLFSDERMEHRFKLCEALLIPTLRAQTDRNFHFLFVTGTDIPRKHLDRLTAAIAGVPGAEIVQREPAKMYHALTPPLIAASPPGGQPVIQFRIDDDDALAIDFVETLRRTCADLEGLSRREGTVAVNFSSGLRISWGDRLAGVGLVSKIHNSYGMAILTRGTPRVTIASSPHHKIWMDHPFVTLPRPLMFLRSNHADQDSGMGEGDGPGPDDSEARAVLSERFGLSLDSLRQMSTAP